jgi:polysaccharide biosynthesis transport protein
MGLVFFVEYMDDRMKSPDEIKQYLGLPFLGMVPLVDREDLKDPLFSEALRQVRTNVIFSAERRAQSLVVTSTGPGEGKTVLACNLAKGLARARRNVLLIDVDMRRPRVHEVFGIAQEPGLSDLLTDGVDLMTAMRESTIKGLWVMPTGKPTQTPAELLSSPQFARLLETLPNQFEWVILDSPPVGAVADSCIVANRASAVLFVIGSQQTTRSAAANALEQLDTAGATFLGAVLNRVPLRRDAFYYSAYYRPAYERYYTSTRPPVTKVDATAANDQEAARNG